MLCQFTFKNFKSYRDETIFDLQATSITEHEESLLRSEGDKKDFLPVSAIYGPNGGGKSGVLEALNCLVTRIMNPIWQMSETPYNFTMEYAKCPYFAFNDLSASEPTVFTVFFHQGIFEFRFSIALCNGEVVAESLYKRNITGKRTAKIYERDENGIQHGATLNKKPSNAKVNPKMPYISFLAINYDIELIKNAVQWFKNCVFINFANPFVPGFYFATPEDKESLLKMMREIDIPIFDYRIILKNDEESGEEYVDGFHVVRRLGQREYELDLNDESEGTQKLFKLLTLAIAALHDGGLLVVDELDASLHPKLLKYIVKLFKNNKYNRNNAQLLFTSHDVTTMKSDIFRRDEIWFAAKNDELASEIYSLYEIRNEDGSRVKESAPYGKQYLEGRYGADPYLSEILSPHWGVQNDEP